MITWLSNPDLLTVLEIQLSTHDYHALIELLKKEQQHKAFSWQIRSDESDQLQQLKDKAQQALKEWEALAYGIPYYHEEE